MQHKKYSFLIGLSLAVLSCSSEEVRRERPGAGAGADSADAVDKMEYVEDLTAALVTVSSPIRIRSGAWWGDVTTPEVNQIWTDVRNAIPGQNLNGTYTLQFSCELPKFEGSRQNIKLTRAHVGVAPTSIKTEFSNPIPGKIYSVVLDAAQFSPKWYEIRVRCEGKDTVGEDVGIRQFVSTAFPLQIRGGTASAGQHGEPGNGSHNHTWYDKSIGYLYNGIASLPVLVNGPIKGNVNLDLKSRVSGDLDLHHFKVMVDDEVLLEKMDMTSALKYALDTTKLENGNHKFQFHSHGISNGFRAGKQLASQFEVYFDVAN